MGITLGRMIDEVKGLLQSWNSNEEQSTTLAATIGTNDKSFTVVDSRGVAVGISPGIVEIDQELLYVSDVADDGTVNVVTWGRGYDSTVPAVHTAGAKVVSQPSFPRAKVTDAINQTLRRIFPDVFSVRTTLLTTHIPSITYDLPADCQFVLQARWLRPDGRQYWEGVDQWRMQPPFDTDGPSFDVADRMMPGRPLRVWYAAEPPALVTEADDFETVTELELSIEDVVTTGAATAMLPSLELSRLQTSSVEQQNRSQLVAPSAALTSSNAMEQRFQRRLAEERMTLQRRYGPRVIKQWT